MRPSTQTTHRPFLSSPLASVSGNSFHQRQHLAQSAQNRRLETSGKLNTFMTILKGTCPACFACFGELVKHDAFNGCGPAMTVPRDQWIVALKKKFKFVPYTYCYHCGLPQDRGPVRESPDCHRQVSWGKGKICPWADYIYIVLWSIWHRPDLRSTFLAAQNLSQDSTYDDFVEWAIEEDALAGEYFKGLEGFLWFCQQWMSSGRRRDAI